MISHGFSGFDPCSFNLREGLRPAGLVKFSLRRPHKTRSQSRGQQRRGDTSTGANSEKSGFGADLAQGPDAFFDRRVAGEQP
jgi:hypothetical protein